MPEGRGVDFVSEIVSVRCRLDHEAMAFSHLSEAHSAVSVSIMEQIRGVQQTRIGQTTLVGMGRPVRWTQAPSPPSTSPRIQYIRVQIFLRHVEQFLRMAVLHAVPYHRLVPFDGVALVPGEVAVHLSHRFGHGLQTQARLLYQAEVHHLGYVVLELLADAACQIHHAHVLVVCVVAEAVRVGEASHVQRLQIHDVPHHIFHEVRGQIRVPP